MREGGERGRVGEEGEREEITHHCTVVLVVPNTLQGVSETPTPTLLYDILGTHSLQTNR